MLTLYFIPIVLNDPYAKLCASGANKNINVKVLNLMSETNEKRHGMT